MGFHESSNNKQLAAAAGWQSFVWPAAIYTLAHWHIWPEPAGHE